MSITKAILLRDIQAENVTLGTWHFPEIDHKIFQTIELPWLGNAKRMSCIPPLVYVCKRSFYNRGGYECFEVTNVENRDNIKIHIANYTKDILGCIGVGETRDIKVPMIGNSKVAFKRFMDLLKDVQQFQLEIKNV